jgi:hypothetical protein
MQVQPYIFIVVICLVLLIVFLIARKVLTEFIKRSHEINRKDYENDLQKQKNGLRKHIEEKAADNPNSENNLLIDLSRSGAISILDEVERCIDDENVDDAVKWLLYASNTLPDRQDFKIKLAELYFKLGDRDQFTALFEKLHAELGTDNELLTRLLVMAKKIIPDHSLVK